MPLSLAEQQPARAPTGNSTRWADFSNFLYNGNVEILLRVCGDCFLQRCWLQGFLSLASSLDGWMASYSEQSAGVILESGKAIHES